LKHTHKTGAIMNRLDNKIALVTGAASGIGAQTARLFAEAGAEVVIVDINERDGVTLAQDIAAAGGRARFYTLDVTREDHWHSVIATVAAELGVLNVLVNGAGIECVKLIDDLTLEDWHRVSRINLDGVFLGTKYGIRAMTGGGSIINISSVAGLIGSAGQSAYNMTKGGVLLFSKSAALECAKLGNGVRINTVHPGVIETPMLTATLPDWTAVGYGTSDQETLKNLLTLHPIGHFGQAIDVARGILFLASDDSSFMTGSEMVIDGGFTA
jgi:3(or 17)beta-hydroxysteroid dehydrogenase